MNWEWIILLFVLTIVYSVDLPNDLQQTSNQTKPNRKLNKARHKKSRNTDHPSTPVSGPLRNTNEPFFPDVIYPTSILEVSQPFYYSQPGNDVLAPFSNDVKSSYKTLNSEKTKPSNDISLTHQEKNNVSQNITANQEKNSYVLYSDEPFSRNMSTSTELDANTSDVEDIIKEKLNGSDEAQNELEKVLESYDILHANTSYNDNEEYMQYTHGNPTSTSNVYDVTVDPAQDVFSNYTQTKDPINSNRTYHVNTNPNYVMTSDTGNTHEDFVNDILNIYSLIEESIRAISVVEFVVSKTLGTLGLDDKRNEMMVSEDINDNLNVTDDLYHDNDASLYNLYKSKEITEEIQTEQTALISEINEGIGSIVEETLKSDFNNSNQSGFIWEKPADENIPKNMFFKRSVFF